MLRVLNPVKKLSSSMFERKGWCAEVVRWIAIVDDGLGFCHRLRIVFLLKAFTGSNINKLSAISFIILFNSWIHSYFFFDFLWLRIL